MPIREDLVASAAKFLQDPSVASSPVENRIAFLQAKNLTQEEVSAALARAAAEAGSIPPQAAQSMSTVPGQQSAYYGQYPPQYPPYAWQRYPQEAPRRDWRDWFIMATVVSGVGYGLFSLGKRYIYPLVAPPTPERLAEDKKSIDEQFERAFALVDQLVLDTEMLKAAEQERTERLDTALSDLENVIQELKSAHRRREDEALRVRDDVQNLKDSIPKALDGQKDMTDSRLREVNTELKSLKTLITQRMNPSASSSSAGTYLRPSNGNAVPDVNSGISTGDSENAGVTTAEDPKRQDYQNYVSGANRSSPFSSGASQNKASIPAWQMAASTKTKEPSTNGAEGNAA